MRVAECSHEHRKATPMSLHIRFCCPVLEPFDSGKSNSNSFDVFLYLYEL